MPTYIFLKLRIAEFEMGLLGQVVQVKILGSLIKELASLK